MENPTSLNLTASRGEGLVSTLREWAPNAQLKYDDARRALYTDSDKGTGSFNFSGSFHSFKARFVTGTFAKANERLEMAIQEEYGPEAAEKFREKFGSRRYFGAPLTAGRVLQFIQEDLQSVKKEKQTSWEKELKQSNDRAVYMAGSEPLQSNHQIKKARGIYGTLTRDPESRPEKVCARSQEKDALYGTALEQELKAYQSLFEDPADPHGLKQNGQLKEIIEGKWEGPPEAWHQGVSSCMESLQAAIKKNSNERIIAAYQQALSCCYNAFQASLKGEKEKANRLVVIAKNSAFAAGMLERAARNRKQAQPLGNTRDENYRKASYFEKGASLYLKSAREYLDKEALDWKGEEIFCTYQQKATEAYSLLCQADPSLGAQARSNIEKPRGYHQHQ